MNIRAVICDIYHTLLTVKPPPANVQDRWVTFWDSIPGMKRRLGLDEFSKAVREIIAHEHAAARAAGIIHPEIVWPQILDEAIPELLHLSSEMRDSLLWQQAQFLHTVHLMPGAADALRKLHTKGVILGLASNSQPYTLREMDAALGSAGLSRNLFHPDLSFFSFEHGFAKPDRAVFRLLGEKLESLGISGRETMMIGNREDNDIAPAKAEGWQTWHFTEQPAAQPGAAGTWEQFSQWLD